jgi:hypothetical protein
MNAHEAREVLDPVLVYDIGQDVRIDGRRSEYFAPALVCWRCEESIELATASAGELRAFVVEHERRHAREDGEA